MKLNNDDIYILSEINNSGLMKRNVIKENLITELYNYNITDKKANRIIVRSAGKLAQSGCIKIIPDFHADEDGYIDVRRNIYKITEKGSNVAYEINNGEYNEYYI